MPLAASSASMSGCSPDVLVQFTIEPGQTQLIPALIGTASVVPEWGYAVPPGAWQVVVQLRTSEGTFLSEALALTVLA